MQLEFVENRGTYRLLVSGMRMRPQGRRGLARTHYTALRALTYSRLMECTSATAATARHLHLAAAPHSRTPRVGARSIQLRSPSAHHSRDRFCRFPRSALGRARAREFLVGHQAARESVVWE